MPLRIKTAAVARRRHDGRADRRALRQRRRGRSCSTSRGRGARGPGARAGAQAGSVLHADVAPLIRTGGFDDGPGRRRRESTGSSRRSSSGSTSSSAARARRRASARGRDRQLEHVRAFRSRRSPRAAPTASAGTGSARTSSIRRATCDLLELIPTADTDPAVVDTRSHVRRSPPRQGRRHREGHAELHRQPHRRLYGVDADASVRSNAASYTIEEIDAITGPAIGRPKSATFRTMDIAGIDVLAHVARNLAERLEIADDRALFALPPFVDDAGRAGLDRREGRPGFYKKTAAGEILTLDPATLEYRPKQPARLPSLDAARSIEDVGERIRTLLDGQDKVGGFLRDTLGPTLDYAERVAPEIAHSPDDVDRAMRWGFGWELGPFETCVGAARSTAQRQLRC